MARGDAHHALRDRILEEGSKIPGVLLLPYQTGIARNRGQTYRYGREGVADIIGMRTVRPPLVAYRPGMEDLVCAQFIALEVKTGKSGPSKKQQFFLDRVTELGGLAAVVHSVEEAIEVLRE